MDRGKVAIEMYPKVVKAAVDAMPWDKLEEWCKETERETGEAVSDRFSFVEELRLSDELRDRFKRIWACPICGYPTGHSQFCERWE